MQLNYVYLPSFVRVTEYSVMYCWINFLAGSIYFKVALLLVPTPKSRKVDWAFSFMFHCELNIGMNFSKRSKCFICTFYVVI